MTLIIHVQLQYPPLLSGRMVEWLNYGLKPYLPEIPTKKFVYHQRYLLQVQLACILLLSPRDCSFLLDTRYQLSCCGLGLAPAHLLPVLYATHRKET